MLRLIDKLNKWAEELGTTEPSLLNFCISDGQTVVVTRYVCRISLD